MKITYASVSLNSRSARALHAWGLRNGIEGIYPPDEFHITIAYSRAIFNYPALGLLPPLRVKPVGFELFGRDVKDYLVLKVESSFLENRNAMYSMLGAKSDFPEYKPHISLARPFTGKTGDLSPIDFPLRLGRETIEESSDSYGNPDKELELFKMVQTVVEQSKLRRG